MMMRRRVIRAPVNIRVRGADHVYWLVLYVIHEPRRGRRAAIGDPIPVVPRLVMPAGVSIILSRKVSCMNLWLLVVVIVAWTFDDVRAVVS